MKWLLYILSLATIVALGGIAWGQCVPDNNNYSIVAVPLSFTQTVHDWVCEDDPVDYYVLQVDEGVVLSGSVTVQSPQVGTTFSINGVDLGSSFDFTTTGSENEYVLNVPAGQLQSDTYYLRVSYSAEYPEDHEYTVTMDLSEGGAGGEGGTGGTGEVETFHPMIAKVFFKKPLCPWPSVYGTAAHACRSAFQGPSRAAPLSDSVALSPVTGTSDAKRYRGLIVGPGNITYYMDISTKKIYKHLTSPKERSSPYTSGSTIPPCFDSSGQLYAIDADGDLVCYDKVFSSEVWRHSLPAGSDKAVMAVGKMIYTRVCGNPNSLQVWDDAGNQIHSINLPKRVAGVTEDAVRAKFFVQTEDSIFKFDSTGTREWTKDFPLYPGSSGGGSAAPCVPFGPMVSNKGYVWVTDLITSQWKVFDIDGNVYKEGEQSLNMYILEPESKYMAVALGGNGRFYTAQGNMFMTGIACWDDWDNLVWSVSIADAMGIDDLILDAKNRVYICYPKWQPGGTFSYEWQVLDPNDGHSIFTNTNIGLPASLCNLPLKAKLAIGEGNKLLLLHEGGYLGVFSPLQIKGVIKAIEAPSSGKAKHKAKS